MALVQGKLGEFCRRGVSGFKKTNNIEAWLPSTSPQEDSAVPLHLPVGAWMLLCCSLVKPLSSSYCHEYPLMPLQGEENIGKAENQSEGPLSPFGLRGHGLRFEGKRGQVGMLGMKATP